MSAMAAATVEVQLGQGPPQEAVTSAINRLPHSKGTAVMPLKTIAAMKKTSQRRMKRRSGLVVVSMERRFEGSLAHPTGNGHRP